MTSVGIDHYIGEGLGITTGDVDIVVALELCQIHDKYRVVELIAPQGRLIDDDRNALSFALMRSMMPWMEERKFAEWVLQYF